MIDHHVQIVAQKERLQKHFSLQEMLPEAEGEMQDISFSSNSQF